MAIEQKGGNTVKIKVKLFGQLRYITNNKEIDVEAKGDTVRDIVFSLFESYPNLGSAIMNGDELRPYVTLMVNGKNIKESGVSRHEVKGRGRGGAFPANGRRLGNLWRI